MSRDTDKDTTPGNPPPTDTLCAAGRSPSNSHDLLKALPIDGAVARARIWLMDRQAADGHWVGELEGDTILETDYVLLLHFLGDPPVEKQRKLCNHVLQNWQNKDGGFPLFPGGPSDVTASVKTYFACKLAGHPSNAPYMRRMQACIRRLGGVTKCNTFTKLYLAIFGQYDWDGVPTVPPEIMLLPEAAYLNVYSMSSWSRTILVPLAIINAARPRRAVPPGCELDSLFVGGRDKHQMRIPHQRRRLSWKNAFLAFDRLLKIYHKTPVRPLRRRAIRAAEEWILERQRDSGGLGAIFPAMVHALMALTCLGYSRDHKAVQHELHELEKLEIEEGETMRLQPCVSPVWDTAIAINSLLLSGAQHDDPRIAKAVDWLLDRQITSGGDWSVRAGAVEPGGWCFEYKNSYYPDVDDTAMVLMALYRATCPSGEPWATAPPRVRNAMERGLNWLMAMQSRNGGWASFDKDNTRTLFEHAPYADHNAMLDPPTSDVTARVLECLGCYGFELDDRRVQHAIEFLRSEQEDDGSWFGRWGVNYIYGTWEVLCSLEEIGVDMRAPWIASAAAWLKRVQNDDGGWGESCRSYDDPTRFKAVGATTASQTAWAVLGLIAAGEANSPEVRAGIDRLIDSQLPDGTWDEREFTGTGFPRVFYLRYHLYRHCFPLWALGRFASA